MANDRTNMVSLLDTKKWMGGTGTELSELGDGFVEISEDWGPDMQETQYVNMKSKSNTLSGYSFSTTVEREHMSDKLQEIIDSAFRKFPTGKDAETDYYRFFKTDRISAEGTEDGVFKYKAIKLPVVAAPSSTGGSGGETLTSSLQLTGNGDVLEGVITLTTSNGVITYSFAEGEADTETVSVQSTTTKASSKSNLS